MLVRGEAGHYPGDTPFSLEAIKRIARADSSNLSTLRIGAHGGTHVDSPRHFFDDGGGADAWPLDLLIGRVRVIEPVTRRGITAQDLAGLDLSADLRVLFKTATLQRWGSDGLHPDYLGVAEPGARHLVEHGVRVVGVDYLSVEGFKAPCAPAHHVLLGAGVIVIEGLKLCDAEPGEYDMYCLPLRLVESDGAPARVVLHRS